LSSGFCFMVFMNYSSVGVSDLISGPKGT